MALNENVVLRAEAVSKKYPGDFQALHGISFDLHRGEILGIIGQNGAGKSTLLKILAEIIPPTSGQISYSGSMLSILDIGTGFHPDLSGYENIFFNASLLGMKKKAIQACTEEIIAFSGIRDFIHEPVKTYSSGMYLRLALSIALFTSNEIILLDEVISVGDAEFRMKAVQKIREQANRGRACVMISHDLNSIAQLCDRCLVIEKGRIVYSGNAGDAVQDYFEGIYRRTASVQELPSHEACSVLAASFDKDEYYMDEPVTFTLHYRVHAPEDIRVILKIRSFQTPVMTDSTAFREEFIPVLLEPGVYETQCTIPGSLLNRGNYLADLIMGTGDVLFFDQPAIARFAVNVREWEADKNWNTTGVVYPLRPKLAWHTRRSDQDQ